MITALSGTTTERNTIISSTNDTSSTPPKKSRQPVCDTAGDVEVRGHHPADGDGEVGVRGGIRDGGVAQRVDQVLGGLVLGRRGGHHASARRCRLRR